MSRPFSCGGCSGLRIGSWRGQPERVSGLTGPGDEFILHIPHICPQRAHTRAKRVPLARRARCVIEISGVLRHTAEHSPTTSKRSNAVTCGAHARQGSWMQPTAHALGRSARHTGGPLKVSQGSGCVLQRVRVLPSWNITAHVSLHRWGRDSDWGTPRKPWPIEGPTHSPTSTKCSVHGVGTRGHRACGGPGASCSPRRIA